MPVLALTTTHSPGELEDADELADDLTVLAG